jgi:hypothetical protein
MMGSAWSEVGRLDEVDNTTLLQPFTEEEVKKTIFSMKDDTAAELDGFSVIFYKKCWELTKPELIHMINDYLRPATTCSDQGRWWRVDEGPAHVIDLHGDLGTCFKDWPEDQIKKLTRGQIKTYIHAGTCACIHASRT